MPRLLLAGLLACICTPSFAIVTEAPADCYTVAQDLRAIRESGAPVMPTVFSGIRARQFLSILMEMGAPDAEVWGRATTVLLLIGGPNAHPPVLVKFADESNCFFSALATDQNGAAQLLARLGETI